MKTGQLTGRVIARTFKGAECTELVKSIHGEYFLADYGVIKEELPQKLARQWFDTAGAHCTEEWKTFTIAPLVAYSCALRLQLTKLGWSEDKIADEIKSMQAAFGARRQPETTLTE